MDNKILDMVRAHAKKVVKLHKYCQNFWNTCPKWIKIVFLDSSCHVLSKNINFIWFLGGPKFDLMTSLLRHFANLHKCLYSFEKTIRSYLIVPNAKSISFKMAVLQGAGRICPPHVCVIQKTPCGIGLIYTLTKMIGLAVEMYRMKTIWNWLETRSLFIQ